MSFCLTSLKSVNVLSVAPKQDSLVLEQPQEAVGQAGTEPARVQLLGQTEERSWVAVEVGSVKDGRGLGQLVLLEIVIQTTPWGSSDKQFNRITNV